MKAVIMAGGEGTRLRPLTSNQPKPMLPMANRPMMEHVVNLLRDHGFDEIVVTVAFMANAIRSYFDDGSEFGVRMVYATEETPLGTAGSVRNARAQLDERFLVISGDVLTDIDLGAVVDHHVAKGALATIALKAVEDPLEFGIVITRDDGSVERFLEKPTWGQVFSDTINTGIYVLEPEIFDFIPGDRPVDFSEVVFPAVLAEGRPLFGHVVEGYWEDVGTLEAYLRAHQDILDERVRVEVGGFSLRQGVWLGKGAQLDPTATVTGPAVIGDNCSIGADASVGEYCVLGANVRLGENTSLQRTVVHDNAFLAAGTRLDGCVIGRSCDLRQGVRCEEGVVLGDETFVGAHAVIKSGVKVYPFKTVESGATVNTSIVWESRGARTLFGRLGIQGLANVDISPELVMRLSMAWASTLEKGSTITASRDTSRAARVLKRAVMVGCNAAGVHVEDLEVATIPVTRFQVRNGASQGGITVRLAENDSQSVVLRFFDHDGIDVAEATQRKIERLYHREEFRRALASDIGDIGYPPRTLEFYTATLMDAVDVASIAGAGFKIVLDYSFGTTSFVMPNVLAKLGAEVLVVNPYAATAAVVSYDRRAAAANVAALVRASGAHLGAVLDPGGERITLVDDEGRVLKDDEALILLLRLVLAASPGATVALPVAAPRAAELVCAESGADIVWTKLSVTHLMEVAASEQVVFAGSQQGGYIFPGFLPAFDAVATLIHVLALLAADGQRLSKLAGELLPIHIAHEEVVTPWEQKGTIMRLAMERTKGRPVILVDGVKLVEPDGWSLVVPDPEEPITHVWAEATSESEARARAQEQAVRIRQMLQ
ncbi:MAG TPA: sugar phosphate nucleotidyltransferase [Acidimicrobiales bacterium]|nr:sugar phosphate nucleotidyltransferase [Acidimicrobiales bacterium]